MMRSVARMSSGTRLMATELLDGVCVLRVHDQVATITLNHAAKRNALGREMVFALHDHVQSLKDDKSVRALVIASVDGAPVFSSGHNLVELSASDRTQQEELMRTSTRTMLDLQALPFPVLCLVDGLAAAAGAQLVAHCDMAYCTSRSAFSTPGIRFGFFCTTPGTALFQRSTAHSKMLMHMLFTGDAINAAEALRIGLVSHVLDDAQALHEFADRAVAQIKALPRDVIALGKAAFHRQSQMKSHASAMSFATDIMLDNLNYDATKEGLAAFAQKRAPQFNRTQD